MAELVWYIDSDICCVQVTLLGYTDTQKIYGLTARCWVCYLTNTVFVTVRYHTLFVGLKCGHYVHMYTDSDTESVIWANSQVSSLVTDTYTGSWANWEPGVRCSIWHWQWQCCWGGTYTGSWADWVPNVRCGILHWCQVWYMTLTATMVLHRWHCWGDTDSDNGFAQVTLLGWHWHRKECRLTTRYQAWCHVCCQHQCRWRLRNRKTCSLSKMTSSTVWPSWPTMSHTEEWRGVCHSSLFASWCLLQQRSEFENNEFNQWSNLV